MQNKPLPTTDAPRIQTLSREDFWQRHISQWRDSGLSKMAYCRQYTLVYHQMVYWSTKDENRHDDSTPTSSDFVPVSLASTLHDTGLSVRLPSGISINGIDERSVALVGKLVEQL